MVRARHSRSARASEQIALPTQRAGPEQRTVQRLTLAVETQPVAGFHEALADQLGPGAAGQREAKTSKAYGTQVVCGVTPGRGGQDIEGFPMRNTVREAVAEFGANVSLIFVTATGAAEAIMEAADAGIPVIICITEGVPVCTRAMPGAGR